MNDKTENKESNTINVEFQVDYFNEGIDINLADTIDLTEIINSTNEEQNEQ